MQIRQYLNKDFDMISKWITDERSHALWCANLMPYPIVKEGFDSLLQQVEERCGDSPFVATTDDGKVVGFFCFSVDINSNEGMLKLAVKYAFDIAKADAVHLNVFSENLGAKKCYQKVGFRERTLIENAFRFKDELWGRCNMIIKREIN